ncbi:MAG: ABC transporter permease [bacterium]|nr:ABC transporter permease [bacterium]
MNTIYTIWLREVTRFFRAKSRIIGSLGMPFFFLIILGTGFSSTFNINTMKIRYIDFMMPGIIGMILLFTSMFSGLSVIWDRQFGFLKEIMVAPVSSGCVVLGKALGGSTTALIQAILMLFLSLAVGVKLPSLSGVLLSLAFMLLTSFPLVTLGIAFASKMDDPHGFQLIMNFLIMPMFLLSGAFFPLDKLPDWLKYASCLNPLSYGVDGLRATLIEITQFSIIKDLVVLLTFSIIIFLVASYLFRNSSN